MLLKSSIYRINSKYLTNLMLSLSHQKLQQHQIKNIMKIENLKNQNQNSKIETKPINIDPKNTESKLNTKPFKKTKHR